MKTIINIITTIIHHPISKVCFVLLVSILMSKGVVAQPSDPGGDVNAPIDGGLSLLIAGGVGYGVKKLRAAKKNTSNQ
jgi:hypothetical protein